MNLGIYIFQNNILLTNITNSQAINLAVFHSQKKIISFVLEWKIIVKTLFKQICKAV